MRTKCKNCLKVEEACYCHLVKRHSNSKHIVILMHPSEVGHALGTVPIAKLTYPNLSLFIGENFCENEKIKHIIKTQNCALFKPSESAVGYEQCHSDFDTIIFIDGTWKKANKIYFLNPWLKSVKHVSFNSEVKSIYTLRKEPKDNFLSTFEAITKSFEISENLDLSKLLEPLEFIQEFQKSKFI